MFLILSFMLNHFLFPNGRGQTCHQIRRGAAAWQPYPRALAQDCLTTTTEPPQKETFFCGQAHFTFFLKLFNWVLFFRHAPVKWSKTGHKMSQVQSAERTPMICFWLCLQISRRRSTEVTGRISVTQMSASTIERYWQFVILFLLALIIIILNSVTVSGPLCCKQ